jgi:hypothetical protein
MNATCPRCGTISLAAQQAKRLRCPTCRARYCIRCQHWKDSQQKYCLDCGLDFFSPPNTIHPSVSQSAGLALVVMIVGPVYRFWDPWVGLCLALAALGVYFAAYLARFVRRTALVHAARREAVILLRQGVIWFSLGYFVFRLREPDAIIAIVIGAITATLLGLVVIYRLTPAVIDELAANRTAWKAVLNMRAMEALLLRFPKL